MIERYAVSEISEIWSDHGRLRALLDVELALMRAQEEMGLVPANTHQYFKGVQINPKRVQEIELTTKHDVIAFCTSITEQVPKEFGKYFHFGVTSSDILDTALSLQMRRSLEFASKSLEQVLSALDQVINNTSDLLALGRSHGMAAEPMIFGQKFLSSLAEFKRRKHDLAEIFNHEITGQFSGAVGNYTVVSPELELLALKKLGLPVESVSTQVIPRDRILKIIQWGAMVATAIERLSIEIRHLHRSDVGEVQEGFSKGQKGSSTMPHKKNPVSSENLSGIARILRSHVEVAHQNCLLWHERDISHSSAERLMLPDHFGLLVYSLRRLAATLENLEIDRNRVEDKVNQNFKTWSSAILHALISQNSADRETLYSLVQSASFEAKTLEEFLSLTQSKASGAGLKANLDQINLEQLRLKYRAHFDTVRRRV